MKKRARPLTRGMRRLTDRAGRRFWIEIATGKRTRPGKPLTKPLPRAAGGQFLTKERKPRVVGKDREGRPVYAAHVPPVRDARGRFRPHPLHVAAAALKSGRLSVNAYRALAPQFGLTERQVWAIYDGTYR